MSRLRGWWLSSRNEVGACRCGVRSGPFVPLLRRCLVSMCLVSSCRPIVWSVPVVPWLGRCLSSRYEVGTCRPGMRLVPGPRCSWVFEVSALRPELVRRHFVGLSSRYDVSAFCPKLVLRHFLTVHAGTMSVPVVR